MGRWGLSCTETGRGAKQPLHAPRCRSWRGALTHDWMLLPCCGGLSGAGVSR